MKQRCESVGFQRFGLFGQLNYDIWGGFVHRFEVFGQTFLVWLEKYKVS